MKKKKKTMEQQEPVVEQKEYEMGYAKGQKLKAFLLLLGGIILLLVSLWLYSKTLGTNLLFTDAFLGRVSRYYWVVLIPAALALAAGALMLRKRKIPKTQMPAVSDSAQPKSALSEPARQAKAAQVQPKTKEKVAEKPTEKPAAAEPAQPEPAQVEEPAEVQPKPQEEPAEKPTEKPAAAEPAQPEPAQVEEPAEVQPKPQEEPAEKPAEEPASDTCPNCGKKRKPGNAFCVYCGYKLS